MMHMSKSYETYHTKYLRDGLFSWAVAVHRNPALMKKLQEMHIAPCKGHPPFDKIESIEIVKCGKIWVLLGKVMCNFIDGQALQNFEIALGTSKAELGIWWDLNSPKS